jgi:hypothetical protein
MAMITLKEWMELVDYRITEGSEYGWQCYGYDAYMLDSWSGDLNGYSFNVVFDKTNQTVYEVQAHDYVHNRAYRMIDPTYRNSHDDEALSRNVRPGEAWDEIDYIDLEVDDDFIQKCLAIRAGEDYDTRVEVPLTLDDDQLFDLMKLAHERDITLNQLVEQVLQDAVDQFKADLPHVTNTDNPIDFPVSGKKKKRKGK